MVLDVVKVRLNVRRLKVEGFDKGRFEIAHARHIFRAVAQEIEVGTLAQGIEYFFPQIGAGIARNADVVEVVWGNARRVQAELNRASRKPRPIFLAIKPFFFDGGNQLTIADDACRRAAVVSVNAEDVHRRLSFSAETRCFALTY